MPKLLKHSYSGRLAYLEAIDSVWNPTPLATLALAVEEMRGLVVASGVVDLHESEHGPYATGLAWASFHREQSSSARKVCDELERWRDRHEFAPKDLWIMDAALQTIAFAALEEEQPPRRWVYAPPQNVWPRFVPKLLNSTWYRNEFESWPTFSKRMHTQFRERLNQYRHAMKSMSFSVEPTENEERNAQWLAQYVGGKSWDEIAAQVQVDHGDADAKSLVRNSAIRFAKRIGLTRTKKPPGRRPGR